MQEREPGQPYARACHSLLIAGIGSQRNGKIDSMRCDNPESSARTGEQLSTLSQFLQQLYRRYHGKGFLSSDPLEFPHQFSDPWDREAVALLSALLAYGNVKQIRRSVQGALERIRFLSPSVSSWVRELSGPDAARAQEKAHRAFEGYVHRFNRGTDLVTLFRLLSLSWKKRGSLGAHFLQYLEPGASDIGPALSALIRDWREWSRDWKEVRTSPSFGYLLTSPEDGSCCKRWCMFLRWMGRNDELDLGLWTSESPLARDFPQGRALRSEQLVIPLDTHTGRISQYLGLTSRKSLNWLAAVEVTQSLKLCDPRDPTRFDFAIARLGILDLCQKRYRVEVCERCELLTVCQFAQSQAKAQAKVRLKRK